ncbi:MAG: hypothetical protein E7Z89_05205 [Cyanobacteria bacterium SIG28]|nr:hypothetical protein [Cyanobacteria bacterium SIG28]
MAPRISLGKCNDLEIPKLVELYKKGKVRAGDPIKLSNGKEYFVASQTAYSNTQNANGVVRKGYRLHSNGEWHLKRRQVNNERGSYSRYVDTVMGKTEDSVSLGHQQSFIRQEDGSYLQPAFAHYPARKATSEEIEAAIDYIKGKGSAENYQRLLRDYNN